MVRRGLHAIRGAALCGIFAVLFMSTPTSAQEMCRDLQSCLRPLAEDVALIIAKEAKQNRDETLMVSFRRAHTKPSGVAINCHALSQGLPNILQSEVRRNRDKYELDFDIQTAPGDGLALPIVTTVWTLHLRGGRQILSLQVHVILDGNRSRKISYQINTEVLSNQERSCLFHFDPAEQWINTEQGGILREAPSFVSNDAVRETSFEAGDELHVLGRVDPADGSNRNWWIIAWRDPLTAGFRNLFTSDLPQLLAKLQLHVVPAYAQVTVSGRRYEASMHLYPGVYDVEAKAEGYEPLSTQLELGRGANAYEIKLCHLVPRTEDICERKYGTDVETVNMPKFIVRREIWDYKFDAYEGSEIANVHEESGYDKMKQALENVFCGDESSDLWSPALAVKELLREYCNIEGGEVKENTYNIGCYCDLSGCRAEGTVECLSQGGKRVEGPVVDEVCRSVRREERVCPSQAITRIK